MQARGRIKDKKTLHIAMSILLQGLEDESLDLQQTRDSGKTICTLFENYLK
jgi:hypothetical protein